MLDKETKSKLVEFINKINEKDCRVYRFKIAFDEHFIYLQFGVLGDDVQHVLQIKDFINGMYSMYNVYTEITDAILKIIKREYSTRLAEVLYDR